ncbi:type I asparaginase [Marinobacterium sp. D7]|uniref:type I asparaginase n=1 Tax=Marinobacterium ramblicola TaxID=2849041 RepID=UPI001C2D575F|nr:type I asparaginase [Marinobacterium ramblicola]MBV1790626.1 type I asparaginase [Marinobacterium ramblicola]
MSAAQILVIHTGGTIGMVPTEYGLAPAAGFELLVRSRLGQRLDQLPSFDLLELSPLIDSAELTPEHWHLIAAPILERYADYQGFIVLHGTDTLAYTASALSFVLQGLDKPLILTGSQIPLSSPRNDAENQLLAALELAGRREINEVCVLFDGLLLRGNRCVKLDTSAMAAFDSPNSPHLGAVGIDIRLRQDLLLPAGTPTFFRGEFDPAAVAVLRIFPGIGSTLVQAVLSQPGLKALVLQSYGVGNAPVSDVALLETLEAAVAQGITIVNVSQCVRGAVADGTYATGSALARAGVIPGADLTLEAAFAKLHWLVAQNKTPAEIASAMRRAFCAEQSS